MSASLFFELDANLTSIFERVHDIESDTTVELKRVARGFTSRNIKHFYQNYKLTLPQLRFVAMCAHFEFYKKHPKMFINDEIPLDYFIIEIIEGGIQKAKEKNKNRIAFIGDQILGIKKVPKKVLC